MKICPTGKHGELTTKFCSICGNKAITVKVKPLKAPQKNIVIVYEVFKAARCPTCNTLFNYTQRGVVSFCHGCGASIEWKMLR